MVRLLLGVLLFTGWGSSDLLAQSTSALSYGTLIKQVTTLHDSTQRYALFVPSGYTPDQKWPLLLAFDPSGQGDAPVALFQSVAEELGYIVAGTYNSRNGPMQPSLQAAAAMQQDLNRRFSIDPNRVYTTGFSGGARVASLVAYRSAGGVAGVIGCGAGLASQVPAGEGLPFVYFNTMGIYDYNTPELRELEQQFKGTSTAHRFVRFDGRHQWPPETVAADALRWMDLQAMRTGHLSRDLEKLQRWMIRDLGHAAEAEAAGDAFEAARRYRAIVRDYAYTLDISAAQAHVTRLESAFQEGHDAERAQVLAQMEQAHALFDLGQQFLDPQRRFDARITLNREVKKLWKQAEEEKDVTERRIARRVLSMASAYFIEAATIHHTDDRELVLAYLEVATELSPSNPFTWFRLSVAYAEEGKSKKAIGALERAINHGLGDRPEQRLWVLHHPAFSAMHNNKKYQALLERMESV